MQLRYLLVLMSFFAAFAILAGGCGSPATSSSPEVSTETSGDLTGSADTGYEPADGDWLIFHLGGEPAHLNPVTSTEIPARDVYRFVFEGLLEFDNETTAKKPGLAERWEASPDHLTYTFYMDKRAHFSDGVPVTAHDVKFTFDRIMDPLVDAPHLRNYYKDVTKCEVLDDYTVRFTCSQPYFLHLTMLGGMNIIPRHIYGEGDFNKHPNNRRPIGSGPYVFDSWETGMRITLSRNENYWREKPHIAKRVYNIVQNAEAAFQLLARQEMDYMELTPELYVNRAQRPAFQQDFDVYRFYESAYTYIGWNMRKPQFSDKRVRKALTMLLDRELIRETISYGLTTEVTGPFFIFSPEYDPNVQPLPFDPEQAKQLLEEAGWIDTDGDGWRDKDGVPFRFEMLMASGIPSDEQMGTVYQEELKRAGIDMQLRPLEWATLLERTQTRNFDAYRLAWFGPTTEEDPYQIWHSSQAEAGSNYVGFANSEADKIMEQARLEFDTQKRAQMYHRLTAIIYDEQPYTFLFTRPTLAAVQKRFHGVKVYQLSGLDQREWWVPAELQKYR